MESFAKEIRPPKRVKSRGFAVRRKEGPFGYSWPMDLFFGRGQVDVGSAVRISLGRAIRDKVRAWSSLPYALGFGLVVSLSMGNWAYGMSSATLYSVFLALFSVIPWRIQFRRPRGRTFQWTLGLNALLACALGVVVFGTAVLIPAWMFLGVDRVSRLIQHPWGWIPWSLIFPVVGLSLTFAEDATRLSRRDRTRMEKLERLAEEARAVALRAQINPHFFFNALNTIAALIPERPADAERAVELLAEALRPVLTGDQPMLAPVSEELRIARAYASLEVLRWGDRVQFEFQIRNEHATDFPMAEALIPSLSLQPILENAVRHGASRTAESYKIRMRIGLADDGERLKVELQNTHESRWSEFDGEELPRVELQAGHALHNIALRLRMNFGAEAGLEVRASDDGSGWVRMIAPLRTKPLERDPKSVRGTAPIDDIDGGVPE